VRLAADYVDGRRSSNHLDLVLLARSVRLAHNFGVGVSGMHILARQGRRPGWKRASVAHVRHPVGRLPADLPTSCSPRTEPAS
jgi:hypothetical protein